MNNNEKKKQIKSELTYELRQKDVADHDRLKTIKTELTCKKVGTAYKCFVNNRKTRLTWKNNVLKATCLNRDAFSFSRRRRNPVEIDT